MSPIADNRYLVATTRDWNLRAFAERRPHLPGQWCVITDRADLTADLLHRLQPRFCFFPHWSWIISDDIIDAAECVLFHMTDLPYGRGGSPLQNLIAAGHKTTMLSAIRIAPQIDAGPVYMKSALDLSGSAQEIFERASSVVFDMIAAIVEDEPEPQAQVGDATHFKRRTPDQSVLPETVDLEKLYDHIRMLDADGYPHAFLQHDELHLSFRNVEKRDDHLEAIVQIRNAKKDDAT